MINSSSYRDAADAVRHRDHYEFAGDRISVQLAKGKSRSSRDDRPPPPRRGDRDDRAPVRSKYRILLYNLPVSATWQDLKDFLRSEAPPTFTNVKRERDGAVGVAEFSNTDDMDRVLRKLNDTEFRNHIDRAVVRLEEDKGQGDKYFGSGPYSTTSGRDRGYADRGSRRHDHHHHHHRRRDDSGNGGGGRRGRSRSPPRGKGRSPSRSPSYSKSPVQHNGADDGGGRDDVSQSPPQEQQQQQQRGRSPGPRSRSRSPAAGGGGRGRDDSPDDRSP